MTVSSFPPLLERASEAPIAGALSVDRYQLCNNATLLSVAPLSIKMPDQQWSYGILFPLDHDKLPTNESCIAHIKFAAEGGAVGVAGCSADGARLTTPETVARGAAEVRLTLEPQAETSAIVIRNATGSRDGSITIAEIGLSQAGEARLAPRHHDLGYDLFVILSPNKTGTQTIELTLQALSPSVRLYRVHYASAEGTQELRHTASEFAAAFGAENETTKSWNFQADVGDLARADIAAVRRYGGRVAFLTAVREPIGRAIAGMFQALPLAIPVYSDLYQLKGGLFAQMLADGLVAWWKREFQQTSTPRHLLWKNCLDASTYMTDEFHRVTDISPLAHQFDVGAGYVRIALDKDVALAFRTTELGRTLPSGLADLTGHSLEGARNQNVGAEKAYAELYQDVLRRLRLPAAFAEAIYRRHGYMKHFFAETEIEALVRRWSDI